MLKKLVKNGSKKKKNILLTLKNLKVMLRNLENLLEV
jgi:hypothetical protein